jgi:hypothetical protein
MGFTLNCDIFGKFAPIILFFLAGRPDDRSCLKKRQIAKQMAAYKPLKQINRESTLDPRQATYPSWLTNPLLRQNRPACGVFLQAGHDA